MGACMHAWRISVARCPDTNTCSFLYVDAEQCTLACNFNFAYLQVKATGMILFVLYITSSCYWHIQQYSLCNIHIMEPC